MNAPAGIHCENCGVWTVALRPTKRFCSPRCAQRLARGWPKSRACRHCGTEFLVKERGDANRQHCSKECAKNHNAKLVGEWHGDNPERMREYSAEWRRRNPDYYKSLNADKRQAILDLLGGACVVCGATNKWWLHVDYIHTSRGLPYRHPRHFAYIAKHREDFRILCANHHYELTLTGRIDGTGITQ